MKKPCRKADYHLEKIDNDILLYHPGQTRVLHLNETASLVWGLADGSRTTAEIIELLKDAYPDQAATIASHVESALLTFAEQDAIEFV